MHEFKDDDKKYDDNLKIDDKYKDDATNLDIKNLNDTFDDMFNKST